VAFVVLLQHENSNYVALVCATTKRHTVVCPLVMERAIAYLRVSTQRQHRSGLGLEAQRATIERFAANGSFTIMAEFVEAESGKWQRRLGQAASTSRSAGRCEGCEVLPRWTDYRVTSPSWPA
jgi:hypothetical protein